MGEKPWRQDLVWFLVCVFVGCTIASAVLLAVGAATNPVAGEISPTILGDEPLFKNSTLITCGSNKNTQIYCTAVSFSIACGTGGLFLGSVLAYSSWRRSVSLNQCGLALGLAASLCIPFGLWADVVHWTAGADNLSSVNLAFTSLSFLGWAIGSGMLVLKLFQKELTF